MRKIKIFILFKLLLLCFAIHGQYGVIELPKIDSTDIHYSSKVITPLHSIYINQKQELYFEHIRLNNFMQLADTVFKYRRKLKPELSAFLFHLIHADKDVPYYLVDKIKSELASVNALRVIYRTNHIEDIASGIPFRNQESLTKKEVLRSDGKTIKVYSVKVHQEMFETTQAKYELYRLNFPRVDELLSKIKYKHVEIHNGEYFMINNMRLNFSDIEEIERELEDVELFLLSASSDLRYNNYVKGLYHLKRSPFTKMAYIEISNDLKLILQKMNKYGFSLEEIKK